MDPYTAGLSMDLFQWKLCISFRKERNLVEAAIKGAFQAAKASTALMIEILPCYSLYVFLNVTVGWFMARVSIEGDLEVSTTHAMGTIQKSYLVYFGIPFHNISVCDKKYSPLTLSFISTFL